MSEYDDMEAAIIRMEELEQRAGILSYGRVYVAHLRRRAEEIEMENIMLRDRIAAAEDIYLSDYATTEAMHRALIGDIE